MRLAVSDGGTGYSETFRELEGSERADPDFHQCHMVYRMFEVVDQLPLIVGRNLETGVGSLGGGR
ncbi:hypothetical protein D3C86_2216980 [compost metagenome]